MELRTINEQVETGDVVELHPDAGQLAYDGQRLTAVEPSDERETFVFVTTQCENGETVELPDGSVVVDIEQKRERLDVFALIPREVYTE